MDKYNYFFVFDVESIGLHGPAFSVGYVVLDRNGKEVSCGQMACLYRNLNYRCSEDKEWVEKNVPLNTILVTHSRYSEMQDEFWACWMNWKEQGALMVADCSWPVEARFLAECVDCSFFKRRFEGPYPFVDLGSLLMAIGIDPLQEFERKENELPKHNPLADARQSARIFAENFLPNYGK